ncbi:MAG: hypothetical protein MZV64_04860 [Ignavibacteriales bacterium]|nr:hypothetical protein [Ignavibacteriales bacterium]
MAETCEWVPEHPARNLREAMQCHFLCHLVRGARADRLRLLRSLPGPELRAVLPARQGRRARHL